MLDFLTGNVDSKIYLVYGLIGIVVILIIGILLIDMNSNKDEDIEDVEENKTKKESIVETKVIKNEPTMIAINESKEDEIVLPITATEIETTIEMKPLTPNEEPINIKTELKDLEPIILMEQNKIEELVEEEMRPIIIIDENDVVENVDAEVKLSSTNKIEKIVYVDEDEDLMKTQAQIELQKLTEALEKAQQEEAIELTKFEDEQEKTAIISVVELMQKSNELYDKNEELQYQEERELPINIDELMELSSNFEEKEEDVKEVVMFDEIVKTEKIKEFATNPGFKSSPYISPVFGFQNNTNSNTTIKKEEPEMIHEEIIELEQTANLGQFDDELRKTNEFLQILKELKKNLD